MIALVGEMTVCTARQWVSGIIGGGHFSILKVLLLTAKMSHLKRKKGEEASPKPGDPILPFEANMSNFVSMHTEYFHNALFTF